MCWVTAQGSIAPARAAAPDAADVCSLSFQYGVRYYYDCTDKGMTQFPDVASFNLTHPAFSLHVSSNRVNASCCAQRPHTTPFLSQRKPPHFGVTIGVYCRLT